MDNIEENIEESIPLTKPKRQVTQQPQEPVAQPVIEQPPARKKRVMTKPKTPAQLAAFEKARLKRQENAANRQKEKDLEYAKLLAEHQKQAPPQEAPPQEAQPQEVQPQKRPVNRHAPKKQIIYEDDSSDDEPNIVYVKKPKKKKKKTTVIVESSSESDSDSSRSDERVAIQRGQFFDPNDYFA